MLYSSRVLIDNAVYHIMVRGNHRQVVFRHEKDYLKYLSLVKKYKKRFSAKIYAYCLMDNHVHMLLEPEDKSDLPRMMHGISMSYTKYFNYKYETKGHLWQGRYRNYIIHKDEYLLNCVNYIELNPVRAKICHRPESYLWSSYAARALGKRSSIIDTYSA